MWVNVRGTWGHDFMMTTVPGGSAVSEHTDQKTLTGKIRPTLQENEQTGVRFIAHTVGASLVRRAIDAIGASAGCAPRQTRGNPPSHSICALHPLLWVYIPTNRQIDRQTDRQKDRRRQTDRPTDQPTDRQTDKKTDRPTDRQAGRWTDQIDRTGSLADTRSAEAGR